jgi:hypothetical protein
MFVPDAAPLWQQQCLRKNTLLALMLLMVQHGGAVAAMWAFGGW